MSEAKHRVRLYMKNNKNKYHDIRPPTKKAYEKYFEKKSLSRLFFSSLRCQYKYNRWGTLGPIILSTVIAGSIVFSIFWKWISITNSLFIELSSIILQFSVSLIGIITIAFALLMAIANKDISMWLFCDTDNHYKAPPIQSLLLHFIYPLCLFVANIFISICIIFVVKIGIEINFLVSFFFYWELLVFFFLLWFATLSIIELPSFLYNIYQFVILYFGKMSELQERSILEKLEKEEKLSSYENKYGNLIMDTLDDNSETQ
ncbi:MAG: hypothetical protein K8S56_06835 [Candidatus Cloacimonetes bacterium]|nr:hypothetical protein [Candidatus Cloacimonadota bacterium]